MNAENKKAQLEIFEKEWPQHASRLKALECVTKIDPEKASLAEIKKYFIEDMLTEQEFDNFINFTPPSSQGVRGFIYRLENLVDKYGLEINQDNTISEILKEIKENLRS